ncbi:MAG TPA: sulfotransferase [Burkholderiaceae bacterium]|nr:sulfotransferase [Burkholderiaceae bacterium]
MKILGVGLSKTGTASLTAALRTLGFSALHYDRVRLNDILDGSNPRPDFHRYDDVAAVTDIPSAYFYRELLAAYPEAKAILTVRDVESWWRSVSYHVNVRLPLAQQPGSARWKQPLGSAPSTNADAHARFVNLLHNYVYGSPEVAPANWTEA